MRLMTPDLPTGTVTLLFSDVDGSTELVKRLGERYGAVLAEHRALVRAAVEEHGGAEVDTQGDSFFVAFRRVPDAVAAALAAQRALAGHDWPDDVAVTVRMGLHTGEPHRAEHGYTGVAVHRAARICTIAHGGQVLLSRATAGVLDDEDLPGISLHDLGEHRLKGIERRERIYQLVADGLTSDFPPLRTVDRQSTLTGTATIVMAEGRRMMRVQHELTATEFGSLLGEYQGLLRRVFEERGGREVEVIADTVVAAFPTAKDAALAAVAAQRAVTGHSWPHGVKAAISVGLHSGRVGVGWIGPAASRCSDLCDTAEAGQIFLSPATAALLDDEDLGELSVRDLGEQQTRRGGQTVHAFELVAPGATEAT
jgi:class 3 adenylate cyclase